MENKFIKVEQKGAVCLVTMNRPPMNALSSEMLAELKSAFHDIKRSKEAKVVVLTGEGKAFVAGADIAEMKDMDALSAREYGLLGQSVFFHVEKLPQPVIAAVNGFALGGGCELAMSCDMRIASEKAKFGQPEVSLGVTPGFGGTQRLPRLVGRGKAKELIFTGDMIDAAEAYRIGLVNRVVKPEELIAESMKLAELIASKGQVAVRLAKKAVNSGIEVDLKSGCDIEAEIFGVCFSTADQKEGMAAFLEKRKAEFKER
ncbi:MAG: enoyl-CoA hydratase-related protein [Methanobacteriota archaeon]